VPVVLDCSEDENLRRLISPERGAHGKLVDSELARHFRESVEVFRFKEHPNMLELDVSGLSVEQAAGTILEHILRVCPAMRVDE